ncbi:MAG: nucleotidyltransferase domain-containing protein [Defluviitaleaceae bacterium]|nr:nucleotidyltransferase domain-containing protein [Defluviitaleaceae bacterium]
MRTIQSMEELDIPQRYRDYLAEYLANIAAANLPFISRVILFGSCARGTTRKSSDIDIFVTTNREVSIDEEDILAWDCRPTGASSGLPMDLLVQPEEKFITFIDSFGMVQKQVHKNGVDLSGFIRERLPNRASSH